MQGNLMLKVFESGGLEELPVDIEIIKRSTYMLQQRLKMTLFSKNMRKKGYQKVEQVSAGWPVEPHWLLPESGSGHLGSSSKQWLSCGNHSLKPKLFSNPPSGESKVSPLTKIHSQFVATQLFILCRANFLYCLVKKKKMSKEDPLCGLCCGPSQLRHHCHWLSPNVSRSLTSSVPFCF